MDLHSSTLIAMAFFISLESLSLLMLAVTLTGWDNIMVGYA